MMKQINYELLRNNLSDMINILEFDAMRSSGKAKMNSQHLHSLYFLLDRYEKMIASKPATQKKEG